MSRTASYVSFPPWQAGFFVGTLLALSIVTLPTDLDDLATVETFTTRIFPELLSLSALAIIRLGIASTIWMLTIYMVIRDSWEIETTYRPQSKLQNTTIHMKGLRTLCPFTSWCWIMLGINFSSSGYIALMAHMGREDEIERWMLRVALIFWELSAPFALLVSAVVRYAIWPVVLATRRKHSLGGFRNQMQHNMNSVYALAEMALLGGLPLEFAHLSLASLVGSIYILFTWFNCYFYADKKYGPQYIYWFMDPSLGKTSFFALVALLAALVSSFVTFFCIEAVIQYTGKNFSVHCLCVILVASGVIKAK